ncbi:MAG: AmmeMemoRadiSam system radical SAM enzyme [Deltaproteobacteria bacterium]|nr:AmmeMemoRadiSam system radical SAM enzyme [Deltaproteobacteria bacterium]
MDGQHEARYWSKSSNSEEIVCELCPHACRLAPGELGLCGVRRHQDGKLWSLNYGRAIAAHVDPIEKKPFFHVLPGSRSMSVATVGCNLRCSHCQNHDISQYPRTNPGPLPGTYMSAEAVVEEAKRTRSATLAFTYTEPTIFLEWAQDIASAAAEQDDLRCVAVSNGFVEARPIRDFEGRLLAVNVDLKSFRDEFYRHNCGARLQPVKDSIVHMRDLGIWVEVTTLLIPELNDSTEELKAMAAFLASVDPAMPWHLSRFHPDYKLQNLGPTPEASIRRARDIGLDAGLRFVYSGNVWGDVGESTRCPACDAMIIERHGFTVRENRLGQDGLCPDCGEKIEGVWV